MFQKDLTLSNLYWVVTLLKKVTLTLIHSPCTFIIFSLKSTPIVTSALSGNFPSAARKVRHVLPTPLSPTINDID